MTFMTESVSAWSHWPLLIMAIAGTYVWRALGTSIAAKIDPESDLFKWVTCVAYGLFAALIARIIIMPVGILAETELADRLAATVFGFVLFFIFKRRIGVGTLSAAGIFMVIVWMRNEGML